MLTSNTSVVMTTFNGAKFIRQQLESLAHQSAPPLEILVGDDGSTDETLEILSDFSATSSIPVKIFKNNPRLGFSRNFLTTSLRAKGRFIAFCDQDDIWSPQKIEKVEMALQDPKVWLCSHRARLVDGNGLQIGEFNQGIAAFGRLPAQTKKYWPLYYGFSVAVRREVLESIAMYMAQADGSIRASSLAHDGWVSTISAFMSEIVELEERLVDYRQHESNVVGVRPERESFSTAIELKNNELYLEINRELFQYFDWLLLQEITPELRLRAEHGAHVYRRIRRHIAAKHECQSAGNLFSGWFILFRNVFAGDYADAYTGGFRFRSFVHDLIFMPRRFLLNK